MADVTQTLELDAAGYESGLREAETRLGSFEQSSARAGQALGLVSDKRIAHNISDVAKSLLSGASAGDVLAEAMDRAAYSTHGSLALLAGAGVGFAVYQKVAKDVDAARVAYESLEKELNKPLSAVAALGPEGITKELDVTRQKMEALQKASNTWGNIAGQVIKGVNNISGGLIPGLGLDPINARPALAESLQRERDLVEARSAAEERILDITRTGYTVSEKGAAIDQARFETEQKIAALMLQRATGGGNVLDKFSDFFKSAGRISEADNLKIEAMTRRKEASEEEARLALKIEDINSTGASVDDKRLQILKERLAVANQLAAAAKKGNAEEDVAAQTKQKAAENALNDEEFRQFQARSDPEYYRQQQESQRERANFEAQKKDYQDRQSRGAYNQSGPLADILGKTDKPATGPGADNLPGKIDDLINTLKDLPSKIGIV